MLVIVAFAAAAVLASFHYRHRKDWLSRVTLEVRGSSATAMEMSTPSRAALWLKTTAGNETHVETAQWASNVTRPFTSYRFDFPLSKYVEIAFLPDRKSQSN